MGETIKKYPVTVQLGTIATIIIFIISTTLYVSDSKSDMEVKVEVIKTAQAQMVKEQVRHTNEIEKLEITHKSEMEHIVQKCNDNDIRYTAIQVELEGIKALLLDLKDRR